MSDEQKPFFPETKGETACIPLLTLWPILVYYISRNEANSFMMMFGFSVLLYLFVGLGTGCIWPPMLALFGAMMGLSLDPAVKGGTVESKMWETVWHYGVGSGIGLFVGSLLHAFGIKNPDIRLRIMRTKTNKANHGSIQETR